MTNKFKIGDLVKVRLASLNNHWYTAEGEITSIEHGQYRLDTGRLYPEYTLEFVNPPEDKIENEI